MKRKVFIELNTDLITVCLLVCFVCRCGENERKVSCRYFSHSWEKGGEGWSPLLLSHTEETEKCRAVTFHADEAGVDGPLRMPLPPFFRYRYASLCVATDDTRKNLEGGVGAPHDNSQDSIPRTCTGMTFDSDFWLVTTAVRYFAILLPTSIDSNIFVL